MTVLTEEGPLCKEKRAALSSGPYYRRSTPDPSTSSGSSRATSRDEGAPYDPSCLQIEPSRTRSHARDLDAREVGDGEQQVGGWFVLAGDEVAVSFQPPVCAADEQRGRVAPIVRVAVAHAAAPVEQRVIEQVAVAVLRPAHL